MAHGNLPIALARSDSCDKAPSLEGGGFELPVPRAMQARLKAKIAGFGCMPPSIICGCRRWPSAKAQSEISEPNRYRARNRNFESISLQQRVCDVLDGRLNSIRLSHSNGRATKTGVRADQAATASDHCATASALKIRNVDDSLLEGGGFELSVPHCE